MKAFLACIDCVTGAVVPLVAIGDAQLIHGTGFKKIKPGQTEGIDVDVTVCPHMPDGLAIRVYER